MEKLREMLEGKKTHLVVLAFVILTLFTGAAPEGSEDALAGMDVDARQKSLLSLVVSTVKAAIDRALAR